MFPHADTIYTINTRDYQEQLRHAASQRLAASAQVNKHPSLIVPASAHRVAATLVGGLLMRWRGASQGWVARPLTSGSAEPAHRVI
jgi:hypothetical protein